MKILVKVYPMNEVTALEVESDYTIAIVKSKISEIKSIDPSQQRMVFSGAHLDDDRTLAHYNIVEDCTIHVVLSQPIHIIIKNLVSTEETISLDIEAEDTIQYIKSKINDQVNIPSDKQILVFAGKTLENTQTVSYYNIQNDSILHMIVRQCSSTYPISIRTFSNRLIDLSVDGTETISFVKYKIQGQENIPPENQKLIFEGVELEDDRTLSEYKIKRESVLHLAVNFRDDIMNIFVKLITGGTGSTISLRVKTNDTIKAVKNLIYEQEGFPPAQQQLYFKRNGQLKDNKRLSDYNVQRDNTICMVQVSGFMKITVETFANKTFPITVRENDFVSDIKSIIQNREGIPCVQQLLLFAGIHLENNHTLSEYNIQEGSVIQLAKLQRHKSFERIAKAEKKIMPNIEEQKVCIS